jgi:hypothetical protein
MSPAADVPAAGPSDYRLRAQPVATRHRPAPTFVSETSTGVGTAGPAVPPCTPAAVGPGPAADGDSASSPVSGRLRPLLHVGHLDGHSRRSAAASNGGRAHNGSPVRPPRHPGGIPVLRAKPGTVSELRLPGAADGALRRLLLPGLRGGGARGGTDGRAVVHQTLTDPGPRVRRASAAHPLREPSRVPAEQRRR